MEKEFDNSFFKLKSTIEKTLELEEFKKMERILAQNTKVSELISKIKILQKKIIFLETIDKKSTIASLENEIINIHNELEKIPIYNQYKNRKNFLNEELISINEYINERLNEKIVHDKKEAQNYE